MKKIIYTFFIGALILAAVLYSQQDRLSDWAEVQVKNILNTSLKPHNIEANFSKIVWQWPNAIAVYNFDMTQQSKSLASGEYLIAGLSLRFKSWNKPEVSLRSLKVEKGDVDVDGMMRLSKVLSGKKPLPQSSENKEPSSGKFQTPFAQLPKKITFNQSSFSYQQQKYSELDFSLKKKGKDEIKLQGVLADSVRVSATASWSQKDLIEVSGVDLEFNDLALARNFLGNKDDLLQRVQAAISVSGSGVINSQNLQESIFDGEVLINDLQYTSQGKPTLKADSFRISLALAQKKMVVGATRIHILGSELLLEPEETLLGSNKPWRINYLLKDLNLANIKPWVAEEIAGDLTATGYITTNFENVLGKGKVNIKNGELIRLPVISDIGDVLNVVNFINRKSKKRDTASVDFELKNKLIQIEKANYDSTLYAAYAVGTVGYDGVLDLKVSSGPIEKIGKALGGLGKFLNRATDLVYIYKVTGTIENPRIRPVVLGL